MNNKRKKQFGFLAVLGVIYGVAWYVKNPNMKKWTEAGAAVDMSKYPLKWSFFNNKVTVEGRSDISGTITGKTLTWSNGSVWSY